MEVNIITDYFVSPPHVNLKAFGTTGISKAGSSNMILY